MATAPYPQLGPGEQVLAETPLGGATAVLTDRRLVVAGRGLGAEPARSRTSRS